MTDKTNIDNITIPGLGHLVGGALWIGSIYLLLFFVSLLGFESPIPDRYLSPTWQGKALHDLIPLPKEEQ